MMHSKQDLKWLYTIRDIELDLVGELTNGKSFASLLEIGSGTGYILSRLKERYPKVDGLEVSGSSYLQQDPDIKYYDGVNIPADEGTYDLIVSFHVLEHATRLGPLLDDCKRVLMDDGVMVHVLPSSTWRFLTTFLWYFGAVAYVGRTMVAKFTRSEPGLAKRVGRGWVGKLIPRRHGELGNAVTEIFHFRKKRWIREFQESGFRVVDVRSSGTIYWGNDFLRSALSLRAREVLSRLIGASSVVYVVTKQN